MAESTGTGLGPEFRGPELAATVLTLPDKVTGAQQDRRRPVVADLLRRSADGSFDPRGAEVTFRCLAHGRQYLVSEANQDRAKPCQKGCPPTRHMPPNRTCDGIRPPALPWCLVRRQLAGACATRAQARSAEGKTSSAGRAGVSPNARRPPTSPFRSNGARARSASPPCSVGSERTVCAAAAPRRAVRFSPS